MTRETPETPFEEASGVALRREGWTVLPKLLAREFAEQLAHRVVERAAAPPGHSGLHAVGHRRFMVPLPMQDAVLDSHVWRHPKVLRLLRSVLGPNLVLHALGAVLALEGAEQQHVHTDHPPLYGQTGIESLLPPYAVTAAVPLIDVDDRSGTTRVWPRSHLSAERPGDAAGYVDPRLDAGDCLIFDYRLYHGGI